LDSLRGTAAVVVALFHVLALGILPLGGAAPAYARPIEFASTGVFLFFVISAFSLCLTMPRHLTSERPTLSFAIARLFRIAPLFYLLILISAFRFHQYHGDWPGLRSLFLDAAFVFNLVPGEHESVVMGGWTIGVEMLFYAAFPLLYRRSLGVVLLGAAALFGLFLAIAGDAKPMSFGYTNVVGFLPMFAAGMAAFALFSRWQGHATRGWPLLLGGAGVLIGCILVPHSEGNVYLRVPIAVGYAALLAGLGLWRVPVFDNSVSRFFGRLSYSVYLLHPIIIVQVRPFFPALISEFGAEVGYLLCATLTMAVLTPLAMASHAWIERPMEKLGRKLDQRLRIPQQSSKAAATA